MERSWSRGRAAGSTSPTPTPRATTTSAGRPPDGRRVAAILPSGGYAEKVAVHEALLVPVPDEVSDDQAAALLLQGLTAIGLVRNCARIQAGETIVGGGAGGGAGSRAVASAQG